MRGRKTMLRLMGLILSRPVISKLLHLTMFPLSRGVWYEIPYWYCLVRFSSAVKFLSLCLFPCLTRRVRSDLRLLLMFLLCIIQAICGLIVVIIVTRVMRCVLRTLVRCVITICIERLVLR